MRQVQAVPTARSTAPVSSAVVQAVDDVPKICPGNVHDAFCKIEGWEQVRDAQGRTGTHHVIYELQLHDGRILRTRVSHPVNRDTYGASLWSHILPDQLEVDQATFWACVQEGKKPDRGAPEPPPETLPADLVHVLLTRVRLSEAEVAAMSKDQAIARMQQYWATGS